MTSYLKRRVRNFSLGMKQHLLLAMVILNKPKLLLMDEPLNGLDPTSAINMRNILLELYKEGTTIIISSHNLDEIDRLTNTIYFMKDGALLKESLKGLTVIHYELTVSDTEKAKGILEEAGLPFTSNDQGQLGFKETDVPLQTIIGLLYGNGIDINYIDNQKAGAEKRYRELFEERATGMMQFAFELKKIIFSKKLLYVYLFIILGVALLFVRNVTFQPYIEKEENERIGGLIEKSQSLNRMYTAALENNPEDEEMDKLRLINSSMLAKLYEIREIKSDKWKNRLPIENAFLKEALHFKEEGGDYDLPVGEINKMLAMNHKHLSENIKPRHATYSIALPNFLKLVVDLFMNFGAIIILVILVGKS